MFFEFNKFLMANSGVCGAVATETSDDVEYDSPEFFAPFESPVDFLHRTICIFTAPLCLSILALEQLIASVLLTALVVVNLAVLRPDAAFDCFLSAAMCGFSSPLTLLVAALSPVANTIDLFGSMVSTAFSCITDTESTFRP
ncbi:hypothetical protein [Legionella shakespearei]|uniref:Transmembrane protein n=1 Tax=Legionella shakespearei DSM 23087 TaxID=1122169 RepID=A0A0W0YPS6_9GAMM|nr:hypothetical protein [Legionella shakespearei]KTD58882.1 hypothetical protein Lsha_2100 [Legionella shakespearei DSM 23087]